MQFLAQADQKEHKEVEHENGAGIDDDLHRSQELGVQGQIEAAM
jgi:hypothetical protein